MDTKNILLKNRITEVVEEDLRLLREQEGVHPLSIPIATTCTTTSTASTKSKYLTP